jgi:O-antigen/teichoic acid export membrane protein
MVTAKLGSTAMVGQLALSFAIVAPIQALTDMALRPALATDARRDFRFRDYFELRIKLIAVAMALVAVAAWWRGGAAAPIIIAVGLQKAVESASDLFFGLFQREERLKWMGQSVVLRSMLASVAFAGVMLAYGDLLAACLAGLLVRAGVFFLHDFTRGNGLTDIRVKSPGGSRIFSLFKMSLPLAGGLFLMSFTVNIPRYFVEKRMGVAALGVFAALIYAFQAGAMLIDAVSQAACVRLARYHLEGDHRAFHGLVLRLTAMAAAAAGCGIFIAAVGGGPLLRIVYSATFADASQPFLWLSVCAVPWYCASVFGYALVARRQMTALFYCQVASLAATLAGSYLLIGAASGRRGLTDACGVVFLTYSVLLLLYGAVLWRGVPDQGGVQ